MKIAIVDDDQRVRAKIRSIIEGMILPSPIHAIDELENGDQLLKRYRHGRQRLKPYNMILLDYEMPAIDGFAAALEIRERYDDTVVILVITKHPGKALEASRFQPHYYYYKPDISTARFEADFLKAYTKALRISRESIIAEYWGTGTRLLYDEIYYIEKEKDGGVYFHTDAAQPLRDRRSLGELMVVFDRKKYHPFFRVHRSLIVNLEKVQFTDKPEQYMLCVNGEKLEVTKDEKKRAYDKWLKIFSV